MQTLKESLAKTEMYGYIVATDSNMLYLTGAKGAAALWIPVDGEITLYSYGVNYESVKATATKEIRVEQLVRNENPFEKIADSISPQGLKRVGFDSLNAVYYLKLRDKLKETRLKPMSRLVQELRMIKDTAEVEAIQMAAELTDAGFTAGIDFLRPGVHEFEVAAEIEYAMRKLGSEGLAFETQVASGKRSAFPHGGCTDREIQSGDFVVIDLGARHQDYCADLTRTVVVEKASSKQKRIYEVVLEAQQKAFKSIRAGVKTSEVDAAARKIIEEAGFGQNFVHGLGHGVGLDIHEAPSLNPEGKETLQAGYVVTDEPGVYIIGFGGVRIEDTILVEENEAEKLTKVDYELVV